jgi:hypothetical protein
MQMVGGAETSRSGARPGCGTSRHPRQDIAPIPPPRHLSARPALGAPPLARRPALRRKTRRNAGPGRVAALPRPAPSGADHCEPAMSVLHRAPPAELPSGTSSSVSVLVLLVLVPSGRTSTQYASAKCECLYCARVQYRRMMPPRPLPARTRSFVAATPRQRCGPT